MTAEEPIHDEVQFWTCSFLLGWTCKHTEPTSGGSSNQSPQLWGRPAGCKAARVGSWCRRVPAGGWRCDRTAPGSNPAAAVQGSDPSRAACCTQPDPRGLVWGKDTSGQTRRGVSASLLRHHTRRWRESIASGGRVQTASDSKVASFSKVSPCVCWLLFLCCLVDCLLCLFVLTLLQRS